MMASHGKRDYLLHRSLLSWRRLIRPDSECGIQGRDKAKAENRGKRFKSFSEMESLRRTGSARFGTQRTNGSKASRNIAAYFLRSYPNHPSQSAKARTRSFGTADSLSVMMYSMFCPGRSLTPL